MKAKKKAVKLTLGDVLDAIWAASVLLHDGDIRGWISHRDSGRGWEATIFDPDSEFDITGTGRTPEAALKSLLRTLQKRLLGREAELAEAIQKVRSGQEWESPIFYAWRPK